MREDLDELIGMIAVSGIHSPFNVRERIGKNLRSRQLERRSEESAVGETWRDLCQRSFEPVSAKLTANPK